jgi:hypothetical protein
MDIGAITAILGSIKTATDLAKLINDSGISLEKAEVKLKLAELISALADAKMDVAAVQQTLLDKEIELGKLREQLVIREKLKWGSPYYWIAEAGKKDGPYCQQCWDNDHKLIRLTGHGKGFWGSKTCKNTYSDSTRDLHSGVAVDDEYDPLRHGL